MFNLNVLCLKCVKNDVSKVCTFQYSVLSSPHAVIVVGYIQTNVTVSESDGVAQLTAAISMPSRRVPIEISFYLIVSTNGTTG